MDKNEREYFMGLSVAEAFRYLRNTYGVQPCVTLHITEDQHRRQMVVASAGLRNMVERAEWGQPDDSILSRRLSGYREMDWAVKDALARLVDRMKESAQ